MASCKLNQKKIDEIQCLLHEVNDENNRFPVTLRLILERLAVFGHRLKHI